MTREGAVGCYFSLTGIDVSVLLRFAGRSLEHQVRGCFAPIRELAISLEKSIHFLNVPRLFGYTSFSC